jgi:hypothetical protein
VATNHVSHYRTVPDAHRRRVEQRARALYREAVDLLRAWLREKGSAVRISVLRKRLPSGERLVAKVFATWSPNAEDWRFSGRVLITPATRLTAEQEKLIEAFQDFPPFGRAWRPEGIGLTPRTEAAFYGWGLPKRAPATGAAINPPYGTPQEPFLTPVYDKCGRVLVNQFANNRYHDDAVVTADGEVVPIPAAHTRAATLDSQRLDGWPNFIQLPRVLNPWHADSAGPYPNGEYMVMAGWHNEWLLTEFEQLDVHRQVQFERNYGGFSIQWETPPVAGGRAVRS